MDVIIGTTSLQDQNAFQYCKNNPINMTNNSRNWKKCTKNIIKMLNDKMIQPVKKVVTGVARDIKNFGVKNQSEEKVLKSNYFSVYKGVPVVRTDGSRSGSFGAILLTRETNGRDKPEDIVRHEYGHTRQLQQLGVVKYSMDILVPSWLEVGGGDYYSRPWEIAADIYGGVQTRHHAKEDIEAGFSYLETSKRSGFLYGFL